MTDVPPTDRPSPNLGLLKGITAGLGFLLIGGVVLLCVLLVTRGSGQGAATALDTLAGTFPLAPGETVGEVVGAGSVIAVTIRGEDGSTRLILIDTRDGSVRDIAFRSE